MPAAEIILQPTIRPFRLAALLVSLRLAGREFDLLATALVVVDQRHIPQAAAGVLQEALNSCRKTGSENLDPAMSRRSP